MNTLLKKISSRARTKSVEQLTLKSQFHRWSQSIATHKKYSQNSFQWVVLPPTPRIKTQLVQLKSEWSSKNTKAKMWIGHFRPSIQHISVVLRVIKLKEVANQIDNCSLTQQLTSIRDLVPSVHCQCHILMITLLWSWTVSRSITLSKRAL